MIECAFARDGDAVIARSSSHPVNALASISGLRKNSAQRVPITNLKVWSTWPFSRPATRFHSRLFPSLLLGSNIITPIKITRR